MTEATLGPPAAPSRRRGSRSERGEALMFAVFALLLLGLSLALLALTMSIRLEEQQREVRRAHLDVLLDAVLDETLARLAADPRFSGLAPRPGADGEGRSAVERWGPAHARVEAEARIGERRASGSALVKLHPGPPRVVRWERGGESRRDFARR